MPFAIESKARSSKICAFGTVDKTQSSLLMFRRIMAYSKVAHEIE